MEIKEQKTKGFGIIQKNEDGSISQIGLTESQYSLLEIFLSGIGPIYRLPDEYKLVSQDKHNKAIQMLDTIFNIENGAFGLKSFNIECLKRKIERIIKETE